MTGARAMFLSDTARTHRKHRSAGVVAELNVYEGMSHAGYLVAVGQLSMRKCAKNGVRQHGIPEGS